MYHIISGSYIGSAFAAKKNKESDDSAATNNSDGINKLTLAILLEIQGIAIVSLQRI